MADTITKSDRGGITLKTWPIGDHVRARKAAAQSMPPAPPKRIHEPLSWDVIVKYEPRLLNIVRRIEAIKDANERQRGTRKLRYSYALKCWYGYSGRRAIKAELNNIIGWSSDTEYVELSGAEAHTICYHRLFDLLTS